MDENPRDKFWKALDAEGMSPDLVQARIDGGKWAHAEEREWALIWIANQRDRIAAARDREAAAAQLRSTEATESGAQATGRGSLWTLLAALVVALLALFAFWRGVG